MTSKANILFVDDEKRVLNSMRGLFRRDYELFLTTEGASAVKIATENRIDVVVADQRMPGMNGTEVLGKIKQLSPRTVRILLTGYADPTAVEGSINIGEVFRFLSKPCPPGLLRETLEMAIAAARANRTPPVAAQQQATARPHALRPTPLPRPAAAPAAANVPATGAGKIPANVTALEPDATSSHWQSVTEVVLSGDTSQEIRQLSHEPGATGSTRVLPNIGAVFFTIDADLAETAIRSVSKDREAILATTLTKVIEAIEQKKVGVFVIDFGGNNTALHKLIAVLKSRLPELVTVVISSARDTTDMISLINNGRVFRYLLKPIEPEALRIAVNAAAAHHLYLRNNPELAKRQEAVARPAENDSSETLNQFFRRVRKLPGHDVEPAGS